MTQLDVVTEIHDGYQLVPVAGEMPTKYPLADRMDWVDVSGLDLIAVKANEDLTLPRDSLR